MDPSGFIKNLGNRETGFPQHPGLFGSFPKSGDPNIDPKNTIILIMGTPNKVPLILGNPHLGRFLGEGVSLPSLPSNVLQAWTQGLGLRA